MSEPRILGVARDHDELVDLLRARKDEIGLSDAFIDEAALCEGHCGKLLGPARTKTLGRQSIDGLFIVLACSVALIEDPERLAIMEAQWEGRDKVKVHTSTRVSKSAMKRILGTIGRLGAAKTNAAGKPVRIARSRIAGHARVQGLEPEQRAELARKAAKTRWRGNSVAQ